MDKYQKKSRKATLASKNEGEARRALGKGIQLSIPFKETEILREESKLMEAICDRENLNKAYKNVLKNKGSAGIDGMTVDQLLPYLKEHGQRIKAQLLDGTFKFQPVKQVEIPKAGGKGTRKLGIPTVLDRFVSQAISQVLQKHFDPKFSNHSYGFRPRKSPHQALSQAQKYVAQGYNVVVDIDLENFFDKVNHDKLMSETAKTVQDKRLLKLIRRLLTVGILSNGLGKASNQGTPQGNPLSPLLSNIMLDLLDKELERRGHKFCRFADDCNVYVRSQRAGERVMQSLNNFIEKKLKLKINRNKSKVDKVHKRDFLGFSFTTSRENPRIKISPKAIRRFKEVIRKITLAGKWTNTQKVIERIKVYSEGWLAYFGYSQTPSVLSKLASWLRRKLRCMFWRQWKTGKNRYTQLRKLGIQHELASITAGSNKRQWRMSISRSVSTALSNAYLHGLGIPKFTCRAR
jgi:RNA-directed DNA polymerase